jgi:hypothetical protein
VGEAITYFKTGADLGSITHAVSSCSPAGSASGRNPGATRGTQRWASGCSARSARWPGTRGTFGYYDNRFLKGCEYVARYNLGHAVPFTPFMPFMAFSMLQGAPCTWSRTIHVTSVSPASRGDIRPIWELVYYHYVRRRGLQAPWTTAFARKVRPEGGGDYGPNSGGYDQLGFGTLTHTMYLVTA